MWKVTRLPATEAIFAFVDTNDQPPFEVDVGETIVYVRCVIDMDCGGNTPIVGVP